VTFAFKHIRTRMIVVFLALLGGVLAAALYAVYAASLDNARARAEAGFRLAGGGFEQHVARRGASLARSVAMLAADAGLRDALVGGDLPAAESALAGHARRLGADVAMLVSRDGRTLINTLLPAEFGQPFPCQRMIQAAESGGGGSGYARIEEHAYQIVLAPVRGPEGEPAAWLALGSLLGDKDAAELRASSGLDVHFLSVGDGGGRLLASSLDGPGRQAAGQWVQGLASVGKPPRLARIGGRDHWVHLVRLESASALDYAVALTLPVEDAVAPYQALGGQLVGISVLALLAFLYGAHLISSRLTRPISRLAEAARALAGGDHGARVPVTEHDELGILARDFNHMAGEIQERQARIEFLAYRDPLTGLASRNSFVTEIDAALHASDKPGILMVASLARLGAIACILGHDVGDALLQALARRIRSRQDWIAARLDGDRFGFFCPLENGAGPDEWEVRVRALLEVPVDLGELRYDLGVRLGSARSPEDGEAAELLLRRAELAMGRGMATVGAHIAYAPEFDAGGARRLALLNDLGGAIEAGQLVACFQPKARIADGQVVACEMLIRWRHPSHGLVLPDDFIPAAEQSTLIQPLTRWVIDTAAAQAASWRAQGREIAVGVNLSARNLADHEVVEHLAGALARHGLPPESLGVEITESALMDDPETAIEVVNAIAALGVKLSIDDFGAGYSSLSQLSRLPVSELKIDQSFVTRMLESAQDSAIVQSAIKLAHTLGMTVVAEGVETVEHWGPLGFYRCDLAQGYHLSKPLEADDFDAWLAAREDGPG
jgi:diguanylate cyclase (GGDEF)-like protein